MQGEGARTNIGHGWSRGDVKAHGRHGPLRALASDQRADTSKGLKRFNR